MNFKLKSLLLIVSLFATSSGFAQILNDSTVNVYGPNTTRYFLEQDVFNSIDTLYLLDTAVNALHRYTFPQRYNYLYQDLGNKGTAIQPLFYKPPGNIGFRSGYSAYDLYYDDVLKMRFYNTKSPYSKFYYVQGGRGVSFLETELSRNISPNWNLGISFNRLSANPQIEFETRREFPEVDHYSYSAYTAFKTDNEKYFIDAYIRRMKHQVHEPGGVLIKNNFRADNDSTNSLDLNKFFEDYTSHEKELKNALSSDLRVNYHIYHQYSFSPLLGFYHLFDYQMQKIGYEDQSPQYNQGFYKISLIDTTATPLETTVFKIYRNDLGIKGAINQFKYRLYYRRRSFFVDNMRLFDVKWEKEDVAGAELSVRFSDRAVLHLNGEFLGTSTLKAQANDYKINFSFENRFIKATFTRALFTPSYLQQIHFSNNHSWDNRASLSPTLSDDASFSTSVPLGIIKITPHIKVARVYDYIYFGRDPLDSMVRPFQTQNPLLITSPGLDFHVKIGRFNFRNSFVYNLLNKQGESVFRVPQMMESFLLYYEQSITRKAHILQVGFDGHWKSGYMADSYMPSIQQFYIQNELNIKPYFLIDFFAAMKINRTRVFLKYSNLTQYIDKAGGYLIRPYYPGFVSVLDVGVNWMFFD